MSTTPDIKSLELQAAEAIESGDPADAQRFSQASGMQPGDFQAQLQAQGAEQLALAVQAHLDQQGKVPGATEQLSVQLVGSDHGYDDYDIQGCEIHRVTIPHGIKRNEMFNVYGPGSSKRGGTWQGSVEKSIERFLREHAATAGVAIDGKVLNYTAQELNTLALIATGRSGGALKEAPFKEAGLLNDAKDGWTDLTAQGEAVLRSAGYDLDPKRGWQLAAHELQGNVHGATQNADDFQERVIAAQDMRDLVRTTGQRLKINADGTVALFHSTSASNRDSILNMGAFTGNTWFSASKTATLGHAQPKHGVDTVTLEIAVDPRHVEFSTGTGEFYAPNGLERDSSGKWGDPELQKTFSARGNVQKYASGDWVNLFGPGLKETRCRIVIDLEKSELIAAQEWTGLKFEDVRGNRLEGLADSVLGANEAHANPAEWGLEVSDEMPEWAEHLVHAGNVESAAARPPAPAEKFRVLGAHPNRNFFDIEVEAIDGQHAFGVAALLLKEADEEGEAEFFAAIPAATRYVLPGESVVTLDTVLDPEQADVFGLAEPVEVDDSPSPGM